MASDHPLFVSEAEISLLVGGKDRLGKWKALAPLLERRGFPKIDAVMGGRYWPAVKRFFDVENGLVETRPMAPSGHEDVEAWRARGRGGRPRKPKGTDGGASS